MQHQAMMPVILKNIWVIWNKVLYKMQYLYVLVEEASVSKEVFSHGLLYKEPSSYSIFY